MHPTALRRFAFAAAALALIGGLVAVLLWKRSLAPWLERTGAWSAPQARELVPGGNEPPAPRVAPQLESLERTGLEAAAAYAGAHGARALIVSRHDHLVFERYWQGTSFDTVSDAQSFTRVLAALATGAAISHRLIGWPDEPVGAFIREWSHDPRGAITVRNLLEMTSGLAPAAQGASSSDLVAALLRTPLAVVPGGTRREQAADPQLLALILERATRERYASYLSRALWRRIGAADAWLLLDRPGGAARADCCMRAHQGDWIRIGQLLVRDGNYRGDEVIRPGWVGLMRTPTKADPDYGAYVRLTSVHAAAGEEPYAAADVFLVAGEGGSRLWVVPSLQIAILCTGAPQGRDTTWDEHRIPNLVIRAARDYRPPGPHAPGADVATLVPGH